MDTLPPQAVGQASLLLALVGGVLLLGALCRQHQTLDRTSAWVLACCVVLGTHVAWLLLMWVPLFVLDADGVLQDALSLVLWIDGIIVLPFSAAAFGGWWMGRRGVAKIATWARATDSTPQERPGGEAV